MKENNNLTICFIGDGTMGEGIIYESMNMASLYKLPILFVCENNQYAQSTHISKNLAGSIAKRAESFGLKVYKRNTWDYSALLKEAGNAVSSARGCEPSFFLVDTYRLKAHSKGDDDRDQREINKYNKKDLLNKALSESKEMIDYYNLTKEKINQYVKKAISEEELDLDSYMIQKNNDEEDFILEPHNVEILEKQVNQINKYFKSSIQEDDKTIIIGEDIADPYGGAFKVTKGISNKFKDNVISTPISEAGIVGMGIGMALLGYKPFVEIMFGDFISYSFDQIISNASKFYNMYNKQVSVPLTIRTPMGGGRGYGPTHSQSIEKIFNGINNLQIVALNTLIDASEIYRASKCRNHTTISIENKLDYGRLENKIPERFNYKFFKTTADFPTIIGLPKNKKQKLSIITYGGASHVVFESIESIFYEFELIPNIIILTKLYPLPLKTIATLLDDSKYIITVEEGNVEGGFGSEIISSLVELDSFDNKSYCRIGSRNIPIPATKKLEEQVLVNTKIIIDKLKDIL